MKKSIITLGFILFFSGVLFSQQYVLLGWNDLGMHCANKYFGKVAVLPPYNNIHAQLIKKQANSTPQVVTSGFIVEYSIPFNTYSIGKTDFWTFAQVLFGLPNPLPPNIGLKGKGLAGVMDTSGNGFFAEGIPVTPFKDSNWLVEKPFQTIHLVAREISTNNIVATTDVVIPVSNEINCVSSGCHASEQAILNAHETVNGFNTNGPVLCGSCHGTAALGTVGDTINAKKFSYRIHNRHKDITPTDSIGTCYKCHPGPVTQCFRDVMRYGISNPMRCQSCHGNMNNVANTINAGRRPWLDEPKCGAASCHGSNFSEEPNKLFRMSKGHARLYCSACHGSPHAIVPTREPNDNFQNINLQGYAGPLRVCTVCHTSNPGGPGAHGLTFTEIRKIEGELPQNYTLHQNYPNPFNPNTKIKFDLSKKTYLSLIVYDLTGKQVGVITKGEFEAGSYEFNWTAVNISSGIYIIQLETSEYKGTIKATLLK